MQVPLPTKVSRELLPAVIALGFLRFPAIRFGFELDGFSLSAMFTAAFAVYFADHHLENAHNLRTQGLIGLLSCGFFYFLHLSGDFSLFGVFLYVLLSLIYVFPGLPNRKRLQDLPRIRVLAIVSGWTALPLLHQRFPLNWTGAAYLFGMACCLIPNILWSDLADMEADRTSGRLTWVMLLSPARIRHIIRISLVLSLAGFLLSTTYRMIPVPLACFVLESSFRDPRKAAHADWILLWPLVASLLI